MRRRVHSQTNKQKILHFLKKSCSHAANCSFSFFKDQLAVCTDNVTDLSVDSQRERGEGANAVKTFICQSTIIPANGRGFHTALSSQSINLADTFLG